MDSTQVEDSPEIEEETVPIDEYVQKGCSRAKTLTHDATWTQDVTQEDPNLPTQTEDDVSAHSGAKPLTHVATWTHESEEEEGFLPTEVEETSQEELDAAATKANSLNRVATVDGQGGVLEQKGLPFMRSSSQHIRGSQSARDVFDFDSQEAIGPPDAKAKPFTPSKTAAPQFPETNKGAGKKEMESKEFSRSYRSKSSILKPCDSVESGGTLSSALISMDAGFPSKRTKRPRSQSIDSTTPSPSSSNRKDITQEKRLPKPPVAKRSKPNHQSGWMKKRQLTSDDEDSIVEDDQLQCPLGLDLKPSPERLRSVTTFGPSTSSEDGKAEAESQGTQGHDTLPRTDTDQSSSDSMELMFGPSLELQDDQSVGEISMTPGPSLELQDDQSVGEISMTPSMSTQEMQEVERKMDEQLELEMERIRALKEGGQRLREMEAEELRKLKQMIETREKELALQESQQTATAIELARQLQQTKDQPNVEVENMPGMSPEQANSQNGEKEQMQEAGLSYASPPAQNSVQSPELPQSLKNRDVAPKNRVFTASKDSKSKMADRRSAVNPMVASTSVRAKSKARFEWSEDSSQRQLPKRDVFDFDSQEFVGAVDMKITIEESPKASLKPAVPKDTSLPQRTEQSKHASVLRPKGKTTFEDINQSKESPAAPVPSSNVDPKTPDPQQRQANRKEEPYWLKTSSASKGKAVNKNYKGSPTRSDKAEPKQQIRFDESRQRKRPNKLTSPPPTVQESANPTDDLQADEEKEVAQGKVFPKENATPNISPTKIDLIEKLLSESTPPERNLSVINKKPKQPMVRSKRMEISKSKETASPPQQQLDHNISADAQKEPKKQKDTQREKIQQATKLKRKTQDSSSPSQKQLGTKSQKDVKQQNEAKMEKDTQPEEMLKATKSKPTSGSSSPSRKRLDARSQKDAKMQKDAKKQKVAQPEKHKEAMLPSTSKSRLECPFCSKSYTARGLVTHKRNCRENPDLISSKSQQTQGSKKKPNKMTGKEQVKKDAHDDVQRTNVLEWLDEQVEEGKGEATPKDNKASPKSPQPASSPEMGKQPSLMGIKDQTPSNMLLETKEKQKQTTPSPKKVRFEEKKTIIGEGHQVMQQVHKRDVEPTKPGSPLSTAQSQKRKGDALANTIEQDGGAEVKQRTELALESSVSDSIPVFGADEADFVGKFKESIWPRLKKEGWKYAKGSGTIDWVYMMPGISKKTGILGVTMFESLEELSQFLQSQREAEITAASHSPAKIAEAREQRRKQAAQSQEPTATVSSIKTNKEDKEAAKKVGEQAAQYDVAESEIEVVQPKDLPAESFEEWNLCKHRGKRGAQSQQNSEVQQPLAEEGKAPSIKHNIKKTKNRPAKKSTSSKKPSDAEDEVKISQENALQQRLASREIQSSTGDDTANVNPVLRKREAKAKLPSQKHATENKASQKHATENKEEFAETVASKSKKAKLPSKKHSAESMEKFTEIVLDKRKKAKPPSQKHSAESMEEFTESVPIKSKKSVEDQEGPRRGTRNVKRLTGDFEMLVKKEGADNSKQKQKSEPSAGLRRSTRDRSRQKESTGLPEKQSSKDRPKKVHAATTARRSTRGKAKIPESAQDLATTGTQLKEISKKRQKVEAKEPSSASKVQAEKRLSDPPDSLQTYLFPPSPTPGSTKWQIEGNLRGATGGKRKLFHGITFLITGFTDSTSPPKGDIEGMIRNHGGKLTVDLAGTMKIDETETLMLIAYPRAYKMVKYIWAVAKGINILHSQWLDRCIALNCIIEVEDFLLPLGYSYQLEMFLFNDMRISTESGKKPLEGLVVLVLHEQDHMARDWARILAAGGASSCVACGTSRSAAVLFPDQAGFQKHSFDCLVTDHALLLPRAKREKSKQKSFFWNVIEMAEALFVPVLSYDWAIQCFLHNEKIDWTLPNIDSRYLLNWAAYNDTNMDGYTPPFDESGCYALKSDKGRFEVGDTVYLSISGKGLKSKVAEAYGRIEEFEMDKDFDQGEHYVNIEIYERITEKVSKKNPKMAQFALRSTGKFARVPLGNLNGRFILMDKESFQHKPYAKWSSDLYYLD